MPNLWYHHHNQEIEIPNTFQSFLVFLWVWGMRVCVCVCMCVLRTQHEICSPNKCLSAQNCIVTTASTLYSRSLQLAHLAWLKCYALNNISHFPYPLQPLATTVTTFTSMNLTILDVSHKWNHVLFVLLWLALSIMSSSFICIVKNGRISFFF